jgi:hypothetical protein
LERWGKRRIFKEGEKKEEEWKGRVKRGGREKKGLVVREELGREKEGK